MRYAKLINVRELEYAPQSIVKGQTRYIPYPVAMMIEDGFKPVTTTTQPVREGYWYELTYTERPDDILEVWVEHESEPELPTETEQLQAVVDYNIMLGNLEDPEEAE